MELYLLVGMALLGLIAIIAVSRYLDFRSYFFRKGSAQTSTIDEIDDEETPENIKEEAVTISGTAANAETAVTAQPEVTKAVSAAPAPKSAEIGRGGIGDLILALGEKVIKSYHCSTLKFPDCNGYLTVTNKRVIFHGKSSGSRVMHAAQLDKVSGITTFYGAKIRWSFIFWGVLCLLLACGIYSFNAPRNYGYNQRSGRTAQQSQSGDQLAPLALGIVGILLLINARREVFFLKIYSSQATSAPIAVGEGYALGVGSAIYALIGQPTDETDLMMKELDALIHDLQSGDRAAIARWTGEEEEEETEAEVEVDAD